MMSEENDEGMDNMTKALISAATGDIAGAAMGFFGMNKEDKARKRQLRFEKKKFKHQQRMDNKQSDRLDDQNQIAKAQDGRASSGFTAQARDDAAKQNLYFETLRSLNAGYSNE